MHNTNCTRDRHRKYFSISFGYLSCRIALNYGGVTFSFHRTTDALEHRTRGWGERKDGVSERADVLLGTHVAAQRARI